MDKELTSRPDYEAQYYKAMEEIKYLEMKIAKLNEENQNYKAAIIGLSAIKATAEAFLKTPIDFDLGDIKEYFNRSEA